MPSKYYPLPPAMLNTDYAEQDTFDDVVQSVMQILEEGRYHLNEVLSAYQLKKTISKLRTDSTEQLGEIVRGHRKQIARYPAISVDHVSTTPSWFATRVKKEEHTLTIQCKIKILQQDIIEEYINVFARSVQNYLNGWSAKQYYVNTRTGASVYDSMCEGYTKGMSADGTLRVAELTYKATCTVPYSTGSIAGASSCNL